MMLALALGIVAYVHNKDKNAVKKSFSWLVSSIIGESDERLVKKEIVEKKMNVIERYPETETDDNKAAEMAKGDQGIETELFK